MPSGIQNNTTTDIEVDIVLTRKGRMYKALGSPLANPTKFSLSDDGVDYNLYATNLPNKGIKITRIPMLDAWTNEDNLMINKIISQPRDVQVVNRFIASPNNIIIFTRPRQQFTQNVLATTINLNANYPTPNGYVVILKDTRFLSITSPYTLDTDETQVLMDGLMKYENKLIIIQNFQQNVSLKTQTLNLRGSNQATSQISFDILYGTGGGRQLFNQDEIVNDIVYKTEVKILSIDSGNTITIPITLNDFEETNNESL